MIQPRLKLLAEVPASPPAWVARQEEVASSHTEPMCATRLCQLALSRSERHSAFVLAGKEELKKRGSRGKAAKGPLGIHSCQLTAYGGDGSTE